MAFAGIHLACFWATAADQAGLAALPGDLIFSETLSADGAFTYTVPNYTGAVRPMIRVRSTVDRWFSYGNSPNASTGKRTFIAANTDYDFYVQSGYTFACVSA